MLKHTFKSKNMFFMMLVFFNITQTMAQQKESLEVKSFSLSQSIAHAIRNNQSNVNSKLDQELAQKQINEVRSMGLPQVNADARFTYTPQIPKVGIPNPFPGPGQPAILEFPQGIDYALNTSITASQLLFDGTFLIGLKAAKEFAMMSKYGAKRTEKQVENDVIKAYCFVLVTEQSKRLIELNIQTLAKTKKDIGATYKSGFSEKIDVDRIDLAYSNLEILKRQLADANQIAYYTLKMQMGIPVKDSIVLTDSLSALYEQAKMDTEPSSQLDYRNRPDYMMIDQQLRLFELDKKRYQYGYAPSIAAFATHQQNAFGRELSSTFDKLYPGTMVGLNMRLPIFDGLQKSARIQQARINIEKMELTKSQMENAIEMEVFASRTRYNRSKEQLSQQEKNLKLAEDIYRSVNIKYQSGLSSSLEVITADRDLKESQKNYLDAIYDFLVAKADLKKALGE